MDTSSIFDDQHNTEDEVNGRFSNRLIANHMVVRQGAANSVEANELTLRQAAAAKISAEQVHANASAIGFLNTQSAAVENSSVAFATIAGDVTIDQSGSNVLITNGDVSMDQSGTVLLVSKNVKTSNSPTVFLLAQHVDGDVTTIFGSKDAIIFGAAAGLVGGLVMLFGQVFRRRR